MKIDFPFPDKILLPNNTAHKMKKAKARAKQRSDCFYLAKSYPQPTFKDGNIPLTLIFHEPDNRSRDWDGIASACKGLIDGCCDAWEINDRRFRPITIDFGEVIKGGKVTVIL